MKTNEPNTAKNTPAGKLRELFPFDWELVQHAGAEPVPYHLKNGGGALAGLFFICSSFRWSPALR